MNALNNLGVVFKELGEIPKAISYYERAIKIDPNNAKTFYNLGNAQKQLKKIQEAKNSYKKSLTLDPLNRKALVGLGSILLILNEKLKGLEYIKKGEGVIKFTPSYYKII